MGTLGTILTIVGGVGMLIFGILILIQAFKTSLGWGLASLLIPFVMFVYVAKNWAACRTNFLRWAGAFVVWGIGFAATMAGAFSAAGG